MVISEELKKELGNAIAAYGDILWAVYLGTNVPEKFSELKNLPEEDLKNKMALLKEFYDSL